MKSEEASFLLNFLLPQVEHEMRATRKVLAAVPETQREYRPHPVSKSAIELAWHIASADAWFLEGVINGQFVPEGILMPAHVRTIEDVRAWYDDSVPALIERLKSMSPDALARQVDFYGVMNEAAVAYLNIALRHSVHHRGQLSAYLRPMGAKVPAIYGESADEPFQAQAQP